MIPVPASGLVYLGIAAAVAFAGYAGKCTLEQRGEERALARVAAQTQAAQLDAHEHRLRASQAIDNVARQAAALAAEKAAELEGLRNERAGDVDGGAVVFGERDADWVRGDRRRAGDRSRRNQVAGDPKGRPR